MELSQEKLGMTKNHSTAEAFSNKPSPHMLTVILIMGILRVTIDSCFSMLESMKEV